MKVYQKPSIVADTDKEGVFPFSAAVAKAFATGVSLALAKGKTAIDSNHTQILNVRRKK